jgi:enterochelin esterase-like enzyme
MKPIILLASACLMFAQQQPPAPVQSPDVAADGRVTFRIRAPHAESVTVNLEGAQEPYAMQKDAEGVWSVTTGPLTPEYYGYSFNLNRLHILDPHNSAINPNLLNPSSSLHVPGPAPMPWEDSDIPHGEVHHHYYKSAIVGDNRDFYVYTPPGYDGNANTNYPVLYLLHGYSDEANGWTAVGRANFILDSLLAEGKIRPMIVVMPLGYGAPEIVQRTPQFGAPFNNATLREKNFNNFRAALVDEVIPRIERMYKVKTDRDSRAIAGLSMGGAETLLTGLNRLDKFSWIGSFSAGGLGDNFAPDFPELSSAANSQIHLLWIACGTEDHLIQLNRSLVAWLKTKDIRLTQIETPGMHTWQVWRNNLIHFAPLLFRASSGVSAAITSPDK